MPIRPIIGPNNPVLRRKAHAVTSAYTANSTLVTLTIRQTGNPATSRFTAGANSPVSNAIRAP